MMATFVVVISIVVLIRALFDRLISNTFYLRPHRLMALYPSSGNILTAEEEPVWQT